mmetsp:Transcript_14806/g.38535  ORF Transcript_14806/g.38535 Transcript_14806/m.38535 type:complete len:208 (+) Transcript_14806:190-813(+)
MAWQRGLLRVRRPADPASVVAAPGAVRWRHGHAQHAGGGGGGGGFGRGRARAGRDVARPRSRLCALRPGRREERGALACAHCGRGCPARPTVREALQRVGGEGEQALHPLGRLLVASGPQHVRVAAGKVAGWPRDLARKGRRELGSAVVVRLGLGEHLREGAFPRAPTRARASAPRGLPGVACAACRGRCAQLERSQARQRGRLRPG